MFARGSSTLLSFTSTAAMIVHVTPVGGGLLPPTFWPVSPQRMIAHGPIWQMHSQSMENAPSVLKLRSKGYLSTGFQNLMLRLIPLNIEPLMTLRRPFAAVLGSLVFSIAVSADAQETLRIGYQKSSTLITLLKTQGTLE